MNFVLYAQEQAYGTLEKCETCNTSSYLGTYKYVKFKSRVSKKGEINNWIPINTDDYYYNNTIVFETNKFKWSPGTSHAIIVENPIYTVDKYRLENRGNPYFEKSRFWRSELSYYSKILDNYNDYTYLISIRKTHINDGDGEYISGDYFLEIYDDKLILADGKKFYLLEKIN